MGWAWKLRGAWQDGQLRAVKGSCLFTKERVLTLSDLISGTCSDPYFNFREGRELVYTSHCGSERGG